MDCGGVYTKIQMPRENLSQIQTNKTPPQKKPNQQTKNKMQMP